MHVQNVAANLFVDEGVIITGGKAAHPAILSLTHSLQPFALQPTCYI